MPNHLRPCAPSGVARAELRTGLRTLVGQPILRAFLATAFTAQFFYSVIQAIYVLYLTRDLGLSPTVIGVVFGVGGGTGVLLGSAVASLCSRRFGLGRTLVVAHLLFGVLGILLALSLVWPFAAAPLVFAAEFTQLAANAVYMVNRVSVEQAVTPPHLRGRVQSGQTVAHALSGVLGIALGGMLGEAIGVGAAIVAGTIGGLLSFGWLWWSRSAICRPCQARPSQTGRRWLRCSPPGKSSSATTISPSISVPTGSF